MIPKFQVFAPLLALILSGNNVFPKEVPNTPPTEVDASIPLAKTGKAAARFMELHTSFLDRAQSGPVDLLFLGDSITYQWKRAPDVWEQYFGSYQTANFGVGADLTQHVLWRIANGELDQIKPRVVVLLVGTNNSAANNAPEILAAITKIVENIHSKLPETKVLLLAIFPRGPRHPDQFGVPRDDGVTRMAVINAVNDGLAKLDNGKNVRFLNINSVFLQPDGSIPDTLMPDQLHPSPAGYKLWAESMQPLLTEMMQDQPGKIHPH